MNQRSLYLWSWKKFAFSSKLTYFSGKMALQKLNSLWKNALILICITRVYASCTHFSLTPKFENTLSQLVAHLQASFASFLLFFVLPCSSPNNFYLKHASSTQAVVFPKRDKSHLFWSIRQKMLCSNSSNLCLASTRSSNRINFSYFQAFVLYEEWTTLNNNFALAYKLWLFNFFNWQISWCWTKIS